MISFVQNAAVTVVLTFEILTQVLQPTEMPPHPPIQPFFFCPVLKNFCPSPPPPPPPPPPFFKHDLSYNWKNPGVGSGRGCCDFVSNCLKETPSPASSLPLTVTFAAVASSNNASVQSSDVAVIHAEPWYCSKLMCINCTRLENESEPML